MDDNEYWLKFFVIIGIVILSITGSIYYYNKNNLTLQFEAWNNCVDAGGQPLEQSMVGSSRTTFTCIRK